MHRFRAIGLMMVAVFALSLAATATAQAEPEALLLTGETFPATFEGTSGKGKLENTAKEEIACEKGKNSGSITSSKEGKATFTFEKCTTSLFSIKCNSEGSAAGTIKTEGNFKLVYDSLSPLGVALLLTLPTTLHIECSGFGLLQVKGNLLILFKTFGTETKNLEFTLEQSGGKPKDTTYWEGGAEKHPLLLSAKNEGTFLESGDESKENKATTNKSLTIDG